MKQEIVLTAIASDRPGLVELLADVIASYDGSWIDSAMSRLGGEFAGILRVSVPDKKRDGLIKALEALVEDGISVVVKLEAEGVHVPASKGRPAFFELVGQDHVGIVRDVSRILAKHHVNVDELRTNVFDGPMSGEQMFSAEADIMLPEGLELDELCGELENIAHDIMVEVRMCSIKGN